MIFLTLTNVSLGERSTSRARSAAPAVPAVPYYARQVVHSSGKCRLGGLVVSLPWRKGPTTVSPFNSRSFRMVDHVMTAGVPSFPQIARVRNVGADGDGNSVSGAIASSARFPQEQLETPAKGRDDGCGQLQKVRFGA